MSFILHADEENYILVSIHFAKNGSSTWYLSLLTTYPLRVRRFSELNTVLDGIPISCEVMGEEVFLLMKRITFLSVLFIVIHSRS